MRTSCCQGLRSNRLVVSEYEVPKVWFPKSVKFFLKHPVVMDEILTTSMTLKSRNCLYSGRSVGTGW